MKNTIILLSLLIGFVWTMPSVQAQSKREQRKAERAERKAEEKEQLAANYKALLSLVKEQQFVLEAHTVYDRWNNAMPVSPNTNFVSVHGGRSTTQLAFPGFIGYNGLGGITIDGRVARYDVLEDKGTLVINTQVSSATMGTATLNMRISSNGSARATIRGAFGGRISFAGYIADPSNSTVFKGTPLI